MDFPSSCIIWNNSTLTLNFLLRLKKIIIAHNRQISLPDLAIKKYPVLPPKKIIQVLEKLGFEKVSQRGSL
jgi:hypothetical protein